MAKTRTVSAVGVANAERRREARAETVSQGAEDIRQILAELVRERAAKIHLIDQLEEAQLQRDRMRQEYAALISKYDTLSKVVGDNTLRASSLADQLETERRKIAQLESELKIERITRKRAVKVAASSDARIEQILNSPSWRISAPVRRLSALLRSRR